MKRFSTLLVTTCLGFTFLQAQTDTTFSQYEDYSYEAWSYTKDTIIRVEPIIHSIATSQLSLDQLIKTPYRSVWINPLARIYGPGRDIPDTILMKLPGVSKFYFDNSNASQWSQSPWKEEVIKGQYMPSTATLDKVLQPFFIKQWEVTNAEYQMFMTDMSAKPGGVLYPDTLCWINDFEGAYNDPMTRHYRYHPKYDDYPVVGVNYHQAKAFCAWYQKRLNTAIKVEGYQIEVDLPNQFEWAFVNGTDFGFWMQRRNSMYVVCNGFYDNDYFTKLELSIDEDKPMLTSYALLPGHNSRKISNFIDDGYLYTTPARSAKKIRKQTMKDEVDDVFFLNTNVSEWMSENYQDNWKDLYQWRQTTLRAMATPDAVLLADLEKYYNSNNDTVSGQLVRGGSWFYEHHAYRNEVNVGTHAAKVFINPNEAYSTLGFRYVIRVVPVLELSEN